MEIKKPHTGLWIFLTVLLGILLALVCFLAAGPRSLTPSFIRYGFYPLPAVPSPSDSPAIQRLAGDGIITDRKAPTENAVTYSCNGRTETAIMRVSNIGLIVEWLSANAMPVWGICAASALVVLLLWATAPRRRIRRIQKHMKQTFDACGAQFEKEDQTVEY